VALHGIALCGHGSCEAKFVLFFNYPAGGKPTKKITAGVHYPVAASVSLAAK
jgi:hypothetical protein